MASNPLIPFFLGQSPDDSGRMLADILAWDDGRLEYTHNYIQWLFPLAVPSPVNPDAPTVDGATVAAFAGRAELRAALAAAFERMAAFYGYEVRPGPPPTVAPAANFADRAANWLTPRNHNMLRITRILTSLRLLGLETHAQAFFAALEELYKTPAGSAIGPVSFDFWKQAVGRRE